MILRLFLAIAIFTIATDGYGIGIKPKRVTTGYVTLDTYNFGNFFQQFGATLAHLLGSDYNATKADAEELKADFTSCKALIAARQEICKSDAKDACEPGLDDIILHYLNEAASPFVSLGNLFDNPVGWYRMQNYFEGVGKSFVSSDLANFFANLDGIGDWSGWDDAGDFFKSLGEGFLSGLKDFFNMDFSFSFRRKRSLMLRERAGGDQLAYFIRALAEMYSRQNKESREISDEARACMEKCDSCTPFLSDTETMINSVCGTELLQRNASYFTTVTKLQLVYSLLIDEKDLIIKELNYDPTSFDPTITGYSRIEILTKFASGYSYFKPTEGYRLMATPKSAALIAKEYYDKV